MFSASDWRRAARHRTSRGLGLLDLLLSVLRAMELVAVSAVFRRFVGPGASGGVLSCRRVFRVALFNGAGRFHLLEQGLRMGGDNLGGAAWHSNVGNEHRWNPLRRVTGRAKSFC